MGAYAERYRAPPVAGFSIGELGLKIKSFLPPPLVCEGDLEGKIEFKLASGDKIRFGVGV